uniref:Uncharacterized protein n=1 Tax=Angiostrongylus cantonensis TaxID=6313 RepID=A0A0K0D996_ANGCA
MLATLNSTGSTVTIPAHEMLKNASLNDAGNNNSGARPVEAITQQFSTVSAKNLFLEIPVAKDDTASIRDESALPEPTNATHIGCTADNTTASGIGVTEVAIKTSGADGGSTQTTKPTQAKCVAREITLPKLAGAAAMYSAVPKEEDEIKA